MGDTLPLHIMCLTFALSGFGEYVDGVHADVVKLVRTLPMP
jgi:hypothetical protein